MSTPLAPPSADEGSAVCVIGAGLAGLTTAYDLGRQGRRVVVLEAAPDLGGLASSVDVAGHPVERFYHFICGGDTDLFAMVDELGLSDRLHWRQAATSYLYQGTIYPFGSPLDLLRFSPVPLLQRLRFGLNVVSSRYRRSWRALDRVPARAWLERQIGADAYRVIWDPLLKVKFGASHDQVSAAWIWHRINRVASSRRRSATATARRPEHCSPTIVEALASRLRAMPCVELRTGVRVDRVLVDNRTVAGVKLVGDERPVACRQAVSTVALPALVRMVPDLDPDTRRRFGSIAYLGVVCGLLRLDRPLGPSFWVNIHDDRTPYNGVIEYTHLNHHIDLGGGSIVYVPFYLDPAHERFGYDEATLLAEYETCLRCVNPAFDPSWIQQVVISRALHTQAVCTVGFADLVPDHRSPVRGLYLTDSTQFYPEDRTLSAAIRLGRRVAAMIAEDAQGV